MLGYTRVAPVERAAIRGKRNIHSSCYGVEARQTKVVYASCFFRRLDFHFTCGHRRLSLIGSWLFSSERTSRVSAIFFTALSRELWWILREFGFLFEQVALGTIGCLVGFADLSGAFYEAVHGNNFLWHWSQNPRARACQFCAILWTRERERERSWFIWKAKREARL